MMNNPYSNKFIYCNIRGLSSRRKKNNVIVILQEKKLVEEKMSKISRFFWKGCEYMTIEAIGNAGGLEVWCNPDMVLFQEWFA